jgi:predicted nucleic acid-binding protein
MNYILDTNIISTLASESKNGILGNKLLTLSDNDKLSVSVLTLYEENYGLKNCIDKARKKRFRTNIYLIQKFFEIIPLDLKEAEIYADLKVAYKNYTGINKKSMKKNDIDLLIASSAIAKNAILVSNDKIFEIIS